MTFNEYSDRDMAVISVANAVAGALRNALAQNETASFAVPGGTTPGPIFDALSAVDLDWERVHVMLTDERWVPENNDRSNAALVRARLLTGHAKKAQFVSFYRAGMSAHKAAPIVSEALVADMPISVLLLGMGADMHTASLFPGAEGLEGAMSGSGTLVCAIEPPSQPETRITLSASALKGAMDKHLVIFGNDKKTALEQAISLPPLEAPIGAVIKGGAVHWAA